MVVRHGSQPQASLLSRLGVRRETASEPTRRGFCTRLLRAIVISTAAVGLIACDLPLHTTESMIGPRELADSRQLIGTYRIDDAKAPDFRVFVRIWPASEGGYPIEWYTVEKNTNEPALSALDQPPLALRIGRLERGRLLAEFSEDDRFYPMLASWQRGDLVLHVHDRDRNRQIEAARARAIELNQHGTLTGTSRRQLTALLDDLATRDRIVPRRIPAEEFVAAVAGARTAFVKDMEEEWKKHRSASREPPQVDRLATVRMLHDLGEPWATYLLAKLHVDGVFVTRDLDRARLLAQQALDRGEQRGQDVLGLIADALSDQRTAQTNFGAFNHPAFVRRIFQGDWTWTVDFARNESAFLAHALAMNSLFIEFCPRVVPAEPRASETAFRAVWFGGAMNPGASARTMINLDSFVRYSAADAALRERAWEDAALLAVWALHLDGVGQDAIEEAFKQRRYCETPLVKRVASSLNRLASGLRPDDAFDLRASGRIVDHVPLAQQRSRLAEETRVAPSARHSYWRGATIIGPGYAQVLADMRQIGGIGQRVLECLYDTDPEGRQYDAQFYWSLDPASYMAFALPFIAETMLRTVQTNLQRAARNPHVHHPFLDYGSPRFECPEALDANLPTIRVPAPVRERVPPRIAHEPTFVDAGAFLEYRYGLVPADFVPPLTRVPPIEIPGRPRGIGVLYRMERHAPGYLMRVVLQASFGCPDMDRCESDYERARQPDYAARLREDVIASARSGHVLMLCYYLGEYHGRPSAYHFWLRERPGVADPARLRARIPDHPMLDWGPPVQNCPLTRAEALRLRGG